VISLPIHDPAESWIFYQLSISINEVLESHFVSALLEQLFVLIRSLNSFAASYMPTELSVLI